MLQSWRSLTGLLHHTELRLLLSTISYGQLFNME
jgi:hypothetical protein